MQPRVTDNERAEAVRDYERQTIGSENLYRHPLVPGFLYTDGMLFMAETCGAFWLLDVIASHQTPIHRKHGDLFDFQVWRIEHKPTRDEPRRWRVQAWSDTPNGEGSVRLASQTIQYSDFPPELSDWTWYVENGVAMMRSER